VLFEGFNIVLILNS